MPVHPSAFGASLLNNSEQQPAPAQQHQGPQAETSKVRAGVAILATGGAAGVVMAGRSAERATHPQGLNSTEASHMQQDMATWAAANGISPERLNQAGGVQQAQMMASTQAPQAGDYRKNPNPPAPRFPGAGGP